MQLVRNHIKEIRSKRHIRQDEIAAAIGTTNQTISRIETGKNNPTLEMAMLISDYFKLPLEQVFELEEI